ncbi:MAG: hypothetical protein ACR2RD_03910, partial [Woeseiaceae bacterium]
MSPRRLRIAILVGCWLLGACVAIQPEPDSPEELSAWSSVTVGVRDLNSALELWVGTFGFNVAKLKDGPDDKVAYLWGLAADDIARQALVRTGESPHGMIHFVEFNDPALPVRHGAQVYDLVPKNLDVYVDD